MVIQDAVKTVSECFDDGVVLTVLSDGKLSIKGNRQSPFAEILKGMIQADRQSVLVAIETVNMQRAAMAGWNADKVAPKVAPVTGAQIYAPKPKAQPEPTAPPVDLFSEVATLENASIRAEVVADDGKTEKFSVLNVATDDLQLFVGRIVSDDDMEALYYRAHIEGARLTSDWMGKRLPCEHKVTSWRSGGVK